MNNLKKEEWSFNLIEKGKKYSQLTPIVEVKNSNSHEWICLCDCGNKTKQTAYDIVNKRVKTCGCFFKGNKYDLSGEYGVGYASNDNTEFYFDIDDYDKIKNYTWCVRDGGYLISMTNGNNVRMQRLIINPPDDKVVDHKNGETNDNRRLNLRVCTQKQNSYNLKLSKNNSSGHTGVSYLKNTCKWRAYIAPNGKQIHLGTFSNIEDAIEARENAEVEYFGKYAPSESRGSH